jgi:predicted aldo/keto reductase-like oxidoreductase
MRGKTQGREELKRSLEILRVDRFDLYQLHGVNTIDQLNVALGPMGAIEAVLEAKEEGLVEHIGITGHNPFVLIEALNRFDFDTLLFPMNRVLAAYAGGAYDFMALLEVAKARDVGTIGIKAVAKQPWEGPMHMYRTWYDPFDEREDVDKSIGYALSQDVTTLALPSDVRLWPLILDAAERFQPMTPEEQETVVAESKRYKPIFPRTPLAF